LHSTISPGRKDDLATLLLSLSKKVQVCPKKQQLTGLFCEEDHSLVPQTPFEWKAELGSAFNTAYNAQLGNVTYYVTSRDYGHPAYLEVRDPRGGLKRLGPGAGGR
jgi:hypothetical protein